MKMSVAMCTYNGARFLDEQLQSLSAQTRPPDELVVCDDGSTDQTPRMIAEFAARAPFEVRFYGNQKNLGPVRNFEKAIGLCRGDIIAPCDQDDVWFPHKLQSLETTFNRHARVGLVFTALRIGDGVWPPRPRSLWPPRAGAWRENTFGRRYAQIGTHRSFDVLMRHNLVTGASMAFRARFRELALPFAPDGILMHDAWIALVIAAVSGVRFDWRPSMQYRQHEAQHTKAFEALSGQSSRRIYYAAYILQLETLRSRLQNAGAWSTGAWSTGAWSTGAWSNGGARDLERKIRQIETKIQHLQSRRQLCDAKWKRLPTVAREIASLRYFRYSSGLKSAAVDLLR